MNTKTKLEICNLRVETVRKDIKNIHLGVYPPNGRIRVAVPLKTSDESIRLLVVSKRHWIKKQQSKFIAQERQTKRDYISGESHYFLGNRYLLNVVHTNGSPKVEIKRKTHIDLHIRQGTSTKRREEIIENFYRSELRKQIQLFLKKWEDITRVKINEVNIKKMKTKWGTCNQKHKRIWFNLELAKKPIQCVEYVLVHEMVHFLEKNHTDKFHNLMDSFLPQWQQYKEELNNSILGHSNWKY